MSTAGKVLSVLSLLLALVWVLMAAGVTQINRSGGEALKKLEEDVARLQEEVKASKRELYNLIDETYQERLRTQKDLTVLQARQAEVEKARAQVFDDASHLRYELESLSKTIETASAIVEQRQAELEAETQAKAEAEALVQELMATNNDLRGQLDSLGEKFRSSYEENKTLVQKLLGSGSAFLNRPALLVR